MPEVAGNPSLSGQLARDLLAGQFYLSDPRLQTALKTLLGVQPGFLGTGITAPQGAHVSYSEARLHEYFAPNMPVGDGANNAFVWILPHVDEKVMTVRKALEGKPKDAADAYVRTLEEAIHKPDPGASERPILARFQRFTASKYSGSMGIPTARRVFCVTLAEVLDLPLEKALNLSGHGTDVDTNSGQQIFIWVFEPRSAEEAIPATWGTVRSQIDDLLK